MKGFYIEITNNLLDPKHVKGMGSAIWEYMWCLDKMTKIDENGVGWVLGGKPIKREELKKDLGKDVGNIGDSLLKLEEQGYITLKRTPYGNIISVNKAKKRYGKNAPSRKGENTSSTGESATSGKGDSATNKEDITKETIQIDSTEQSSGVEINEMINLFKEVNPSYALLYARPPQRKAVARMINIHGIDLLSRVISYLPKSNAVPYLPTITTPIRLEEKWADLEAGIKKIKNKTLSTFRGLET